MPAKEIVTGANPEIVAVYGADVVVIRGAGVPTDGSSGTGAGIAGIGSQYIDSTNGNLYINGGAGTKAAPVWKLVTKAA